MDSPVTIFLIVFFVLAISMIIFTVAAVFSRRQQLAAEVPVQGRHPIGEHGLSAIATHGGGDYNHVNAALYWTPEAEAAEMYRAWAARRCPWSDTWVIRIREGLSDILILGNHLPVSTSCDHITLDHHAKRYPPFQCNSRRIRTMQNQPSTNPADFRQIRVEDGTVPDFTTTTRASVIEANLVQSQGVINQPACERCQGSNSGLYVESVG
jgi:hypothetical protein